MELTKQVVSLSIAKKLKELGVKQESTVWWSYTDAPLPDGGRWALRYEKHMSDADFEMAHEDDNIAAFTVAELGELLPARVDCGENGELGERYASLVCEKHAGYEVKYILYHKGTGHIMNGYEKGARFHADTEADARAKMLIYLRENNLLTPSLSVEEKEV